MSQTNWEKLRRDGKVAVLYSPGFGAGWSTWNTDEPGLLFDSEIAEAVLNGNRAEALAIAGRKYPHAYLGGIETLRVAWLNEGDQFEVEEYDGNEGIHVIGQGSYFTA
jgi:hypothetical protein